MLMSSNGALGVVGLTPFLHIRVVTEMFGDGSVFRTFFTVHNPGLSKPYEEVFQPFAEQFEDAAYINHRMDQIRHALTVSRSDEHTSELQSLIPNSHAVCRRTIQLPSLFGS